MMKKDEVFKYFDLALTNITNFGDTDIFPYPIENRIFLDKKKVQELLLKAYLDFDNFFNSNTPQGITVFDYIEFFYNPKRKHGNNGMLSPIEFERQQKWKLKGV